MSEFWHKSDRWVFKSTWKGHEEAVEEHFLAPFVIFLLLSIYVVCLHFAKCEKSFMVPWNCVLWLLLGRPGSETCEYQLLSLTVLYYVSHILYSTLCIELVVFHITMCKAWQDCLLGARWKRICMRGNAEQDSALQHQHQHELRDQH